MVYGLKDVHAVDSCQRILLNEPSVVIDKRYGVINQNQPLFVQKDLIGDEGSMLCGPTCAFNALEKFRMVTGKKSTKTVNPQGVVDFVTKADDLLPISKRDIIQRGLIDTELAETLRVTLQEEHIPAKVSLVVTQDKVQGAGSTFTLADLKISTNSHNAVIVLTQKYNTPDPIQANEYNFMYGHFLIVNGYDSANPHRIFFNDPFRPHKVRSAILVPVRPDSYHAPTYEVLFEDIKDPSHRILISSVISLQLLTSGENQ